MCLRHAIRQERVFRSFVAWCPVFIMNSPPLSLGVLDDMIGFRLRRAHSEALRQLDAELAEQGVTTAMVGTLEILAHNGRVVQGLVAEALGLNRSTMVPIIEKLHDKGWIARDRTPEDRRAVLLRLTDEGRRALRQLRRLAKAQEERLREMLAPIDQEVFLEGLRLLSRP